MVQLTIEDAIARRDEGISRASEHAEREAPGWKRRALGYVKEYLATHPRGVQFLAEDVREFAEKQGLDFPPDGRAWGNVMQTAKREALIVSRGFAPARSSNLSAKVLWEGV